MATKEDISGLLSKMARFVRNPTKDWSELSRPEPESTGESVHTESALQELNKLKRKSDFVRRQDFVRRREFDYLRKLRSKGLLNGSGAMARPSIFRASIISNLDEKASTLKKIDEIETQMSAQWWQGKPDEAPVQGENSAVDGYRRRAMDKPEPTRVAMPEKANTVALAKTPKPGIKPDPKPGADYETTRIGMPAQGDSGADRTPLPMESGGFEERNLDGAPSEFLNSKLLSVELGEVLNDPDLEEAAIRFANGDDSGAESGLLAVLQTNDVTPESADVWASALFDLYRATGQQSSFDDIAIYYAQRFGRSAPAWFSTPELLEREEVASPSERIAVPEQDRQIVWDCPAELDLPSVQTLRSSQSHSAPVWHLNWCRLEAITPEAAKALADLFSEWSVQPVKLQFDAADILLEKLRSLTPMKDKRVDVCWWKLRLDALRILRMQDEFELAALNFCVTYEVAPSPWTDARCEYVNESFKSTLTFGDTQSLSGAAGSGSSMKVDQAGPSQVLPDAMSPVVVELTGEVLGDAIGILEQLEGQLIEDNRLVISCARLIRVDFSAAGSILNWVSARNSEGCQVQFRDVPRLVAAFFNVIGINEYAQVDLRAS